MKFKIDKSINSSGEIIGLKRTLFYGFVAISVIIVLATFSKITLSKLFIGVILDVIAYLILKKLSYFNIWAFIGNEKLPDIIINNRFEESLINENISK